MPELPEVEVVRAGLAPAVTGARIAGVEVRDERSLKRHHPLDETHAASDFERRLLGATMLDPARRGKFMWIPLAGAHGGAPEHALLAHLGMSGQVLLRAHEAPDDRHVRIRLWVEHPEHGELRVDFADQRLFGSLAIDDLEATPDGQPAGKGTRLALIPGQAAHIARDPLDPAFDDDAFIAGLRRKHSGVKKALLDQTLISGVGNIYADETLWRARVNPDTFGSSLSARKAAELLVHAREVFGQALIEGGTSFDEQYVNVNGQAGYFAHSLNAYKQTGEPCPRCGTPIKRVPFQARASHYCPRCQRKR